jgi:hypothetical protein
LGGGNGSGKLPHKILDIPELFGRNRFLISDKGFLKIKEMSNKINKLLKTLNTGIIIFLLV